ncbi:hypothetical protein Pfo_031357 [Paulownia fortunei]|nr:hypothetical protein Pfo_031357 [Paulownia fortunei]
MQLPAISFFLWLKLCIIKSVNLRLPTSFLREIFDYFKNEKGDFKSSHVDDTKGLLQLYEASFLLTEGEKTLELAREFATNFLQKKLDDEGHGMDEDLSLLVRNALELPLHWRIQRPNARWFIDAYGRRPDMNSVVLELAKLDFNIVQAKHQEELKHVSRWWEQTCLAEKLPFARNRLVECYFWTIGGLFLQPQYGYSRIMATKVNALLTVFDDMFDVYGTLEELQLFNNAIQRLERKNYNSSISLFKVVRFMQCIFRRGKVVLQGLYTKTGRIYQQCLDFNISSCHTIPCIFSCDKSNREGGCSKLV